MSVTIGLGIGRLSALDRILDLTKTSLERLAMSEYNGHPSKGHWNVSSWISNDWALYTLAQMCINESSTIRQATQEFLKYVDEKTPDGFLYSYERVYHTLKGISE